MRRFILIVSFISLLVISGCINSNKTTTTTSNNTTDTTTTEEFTTIIKDIHDSDDLTEERSKAENKNNTIIIDNRNEEFTYTRALLKTANDKSSFIGDDYIISDGTSNFSARWTPNIEKAGYYKIYILWPNYDNQEYLNVEVVYEGGNNTDQTKIFNQQYNAGYWVYVGNYYLTIGTDNYVSVKGTDGKVYAIDSVMFELSVEIKELRTEPQLRKFEDVITPTEVRIVREQNGAFYLTINGEKFYGKGVADIAEFDLMVEAGINMARVYSVNNLSGGILDKAQELGIKIVVGIWLNKESAQFNYRDNPERVQEQFNRIVEEVNQYKGHPAILAWAIGNEVDPVTAVSPEHIYRAMNDIARYIHEVDPFHPTMSVIASANQTKMMGINRFAPHIDIMGVNNYANIHTAHEKITYVWKGPYMIGEYAIDQPMQTKEMTAWGAIIEPNDKEKMTTYSNRYLENIYRYRDANNVGSFVFKGAGAFRVTHTWYNLIIDGKKTPTYYAMKAAWTGEEIPVNIPIIFRATIDGYTKYQNVTVEQGTKHLIELNMENAEGENLTFKYEIRREVGLEVDYAPGVIRDVIFEEVPGDQHKMYFTAPLEPGYYRLFIYATNDRDQITTYNIPFQVTGEPFVLEEQEGFTSLDRNSSEFSIISGNWKDSSNIYYKGEKVLYSNDTNAMLEIKPKLSSGRYKLYFYNTSEGLSKYDETEILIEINFKNNQKQTFTFFPVQSKSGWNFIEEFDFSEVEAIRIMKLTDTGKAIRVAAFGFLPIE